MRRVFALIVIFLILCFFFAQWYLCHIRGLCNFPGDQYVGDKAMAILQVIFMLLFAFLLGFAIAWLLRQQSIKSLTNQLDSLINERDQWERTARNTENENLHVRKQLAEAQNSAHEWETTSKEKSRLLEEWQNAIVSGREESLRLNHRYENLKTENDSLREMIAHLKKEVDIKGSIPLPPAEGTPKPIIVPSRFTPNTWQTRDDLTLIKGIGPVIQRKLIEIGISTFRQISEFSEEDIHRVSGAIRFFPGRIERDNWRAQAAALYASK